MREGVTVDRGCITINNLIHMLKSDDIVMDGRRKQSMLTDAEIAQTANYGETNISVDFTCLEPMTTINSDTNSEVDFQ